MTRWVKESIGRGFESLRRRKLKLYEDNRKLIRYVSKAYYSWEVWYLALTEVVFIYSFFGIPWTVQTGWVYLNITCKGFNLFLVGLCMISWNPHTDLLGKPWCQLGLESLSIHHLEKSWRPKVRELVDTWVLKLMSERLNVAESLPSIQFFGYL